MGLTSGAIGHFQPLFIKKIKIWVLRPFQEYFTYIGPIVNQRWAKTGIPGEKPPDQLVRNLASHVPRARLEPQR